ncbi:MAG: VWA domain-containing protein [Gammaproteobacteria bacterium]|nr:VWA domain-containing protein [Gammaproteobacteria bacterium]
MLIKFFFMLREGGLKPSITELLTLLEALQSNVAEHSVDNFYYLARACLVKDETKFDLFDRIFAAHFQGIEDAFRALGKDLPEDWLRKQAELMLSEEERAQIEAMGGFDKLMEALRQRLEEQDERHEGGSKWIGTAGTSPFGAYGYNPEGVRIGQQGSRHRRGTKVWDRREYRNLDDKVELGTRNIKIALRKLRKFAREGAADLLDLDDTIDKTARNAGLLDIRMVPERHNAIKVLLCLDIGGSMDDHVRVCEELFSATRSEFKHLEYFYFHNFIYESMWKDNRRRHAERIATSEITHKYGADYKLIFVGDATMSPYEIVYAGGSVEHWNEEPGAVWIKRLLNTFPKAIWLNPEPDQRWDYTPSIKITRELMDDRMFPLTVAGLDDGIKSLH